MVRILGSLALLAAVIVAVATRSAQVSPQSDHANYVENPTSASSLSGDTMSSVYKLPFEWSSDYETEVNTLMSGWSEADIKATYTDSDKNSGVSVAKIGFLKYCNMLKSKVAHWTNSIQNTNDVSGKFKIALSDWYQKLELSAREKFRLPSMLTLGYIRGKFMFAFKQLLSKGSLLMYKLDGDGAKKKVEKFVKDMADKMVGILKDIKKKVKDIYKDFEN